MRRPEFEHITSGKEFDNWYWLKSEMVAICKKAKLPVTGSKFELRDRIMYALDTNGKELPKVKANKKESKFNWAKAELSLETVITDTVSFGPNFRNFMKQQIGSSFSCHGDFMKWVRNNKGKNLKDAVAEWKKLENRKKDPSFKKVIADNNMYNQYLRDFMEVNPTFPLDKAKKCWLRKKQLPTQNGFVKFENSDLTLLDDN